MGVIVKTPDGQKLDVDVGAALMADLPDYKVRDLNLKNGTALVEDKDGNQTEIDVAAKMRADGLEILEAKEANSPMSAVEQSPLSFIDRAKLGLLNYESGEVSRLANMVKGSMSIQEMDAQDAATQKRALNGLKTKFEDATIANGEYVVKKDGVWYKANAAGADLGDLTQFAAGSGLNIVFGGVGGAVGTFLGGPGPGTVVGGIGGSMIGEAAEEMLAAAISGGEIDAKSAAGDLVLDGITSLGGAAVVKVASVGGKALLASKVGKATVESVAKVSDQLMDGFEGIANWANPAVKDMIAGVYGSVSPGVSTAALRETIDSPENTRQVKTLVKLVATGDKGKSKVMNSMTQLVQNGAERLRQVNMAKFGAVIDNIANKLDDRYVIDLDDMAKSINTFMEGMDPALRGTYSNTLKVIKEMSEKMGNSKVKSTLLDASGKVIEDSATKKTQLKGKEAFAVIRRLKDLHTSNMDASGFFNKQVAPSAADAVSKQKAYEMLSFIDDKILEAANKTELTPALEAVKKNYGETKDLLGTFFPKIFKNGSDIDNVRKLVNGKINDATDQAIKRLNELHPEAAFGGTIKKAQRMEAALEMAPLLSPPKNLIQSGLLGAGVTGTILTGGASLPAAVVAAPLVSPRAAFFTARNLTSLTRGAAATVRVPKQAAEVGAKQLVRLAATTRFLENLPAGTARALLNNTDAFRQMLDNTNALVSSAPQDTEAAALEAATQMAEQKMQGGK